MRPDQPNYNHPYVRTLIDAAETGLSPFHRDVLAECIVKTLDEEWWKVIEAVCVLEGIDFAGLRPRLEMQRWIVRAKVEAQELAESLSKPS